jgi:uncharacterized protein YjbI with pentapeptide repeats
MADDAAIPGIEEGDFFADVTFSELSLPGVDLAGKEFQRCTFRRCKLGESRWARAKLEECSFEACDLAGMVPRELALRGVTFKGTRLMGVDWSDIAKFPQVSFEGCDLRYASFMKLRLPSTKITGCVARDANFIELDLQGADFTGTDLTGSTIQGCTLAKTNFSRATGVFFDPQKNRVKGVRIAIETAVLLVQSFGIVVEELAQPGS